GSRCSTDTFSSGRRCATRHAARTASTAVRRAFSGSERASRLSRSTAGLVGSGAAGVTGTTGEMDGVTGVDGADVVMDAGGCDDAVSGGSDAGAWGGGVRRAVG